MDTHVCHFLGDNKVSKSAVCELVFCSLCGAATVSKRHFFGHKNAETEKIMSFCKKTYKNLQKTQQTNQPPWPCKHAQKWKRCTPKTAKSCVHLAQTCTSIVKKIQNLNIHMFRYLTNLCFTNAA